jgi:hypothetical protein
MNKKNSSLEIFLFKLLIIIKYNMVKIIGEKFKIEIINLNYNLI